MDVDDGRWTMGISRALSLPHRPSSAGTLRFISLSSALALGSFVAVGYYLVATQWNALELLRAPVGLAALWGPATALIYILLRTQVPDTLARFTFSAIGSYALTTLAYFGAGVLGMPPLFYAALIAVALLDFRFWILDFGLGVRFNPKSKIQNPKSIDWILVALISASLVVNVRFQTVYSVSPATGERTFLVDGDQTYYASLVYELARHTPPLQQAINAGVPERAYHIFPHLTTMLISQFTSQGDVVRAHIVYEYAAIEILMCLAFYCIVRTLTRSRWAGYIGVALLYLFAVPLPPIVDSKLSFFFFTYHPYATSGLEPVVITAPQMYSGLLVLYGIMLGVLLVSVRSYSYQRVSALLAPVGLMVGEMLRIRVQIYIPLVIGFVLLACYGLWRTRQLAYLATIGIALTVSALLYLEMRSPLYLENSAALKLGPNGEALVEAHSWMNSWPFSESVQSWLSSAIPNKAVFDWAWPIISLSSFVLFNMLGLPLIVATVLYLGSRPAFREWRLYSGLSLWLVGASIAGAMLISTDYDDYSVGGQMLFHTLWYMLPLLGVGVWWCFRALQLRVSWLPQVWSVVAASAVLFALVVQLVRPPSMMEIYARSRSQETFSNNDWRALSYIHDSLPQQSVIISNGHLEADKAVFSGIGGRAGYYEYGVSTLGSLTSSSGIQENRPARIQALWSATTSSEFCGLILPTIVTHLVEYSNSPLAVRNPSCMRQVWSIGGSKDRITIYQVLRTTTN